MKISAECIAELKKLGVSSLYLFGSRAQGVERRDSDYDFGILMKEPRVLRAGTQDLYQKIYDLLQDAVGVKANLDIVFLDRAPLQLRYHVIRSGKVLFDSNPQRRGRFIERTMIEHADFEPHRKRFEEAILARIP